LGVRFAVGDVRDDSTLRSAVAGAEVVYHLAGLTSAFSARDLMEVNAEGFKNVVAACAESATPPVLLLVSSLSAAGPSPPNRARTESDPPMPVSNYGRAKRTAELTAQQYAARVPITIVRPPIVFGEGDVLMRDLFRSIFRYGVYPALLMAQSQYSLIHVHDLVESLMLCADSGTRLSANGAPRAPCPPPGYYFVATDEQPTFAELGELIARSLGRQSVRILRTSGPALLWSAAALAEIVARLRGQPYIFNLDKVREAKAGNWVCSTLTIRRLGFATGAPFVDRLRQTADWYRQQNWL
jgi:nucleoside-diphosphate-sugar epimerase